MVHAKATHLASLVGKAIAQYEAEVNKKGTSRAEDGSLEAYAESASESALDDLDSIFWGSTEKLGKARISFIRSHPDQFVMK